MQLLNVDFIKYARKEKGITQKQTAEFININEQSYRNFENKKYGLSIPALEKLIQVLDLQKAELQDIFDFTQKSEL
jgi:DNA-binding XRE family transcriptional regulator